MTENAALSGVRVLDFTRVLAGPFCTMLLADMGADVIKVESLQGDDTRQWGPPWYESAGEQVSAYYLSVNRNKRSIALNLKHPAGQKIAREVAAQSDIVVENLKPGGMSAFGLGYEDLRAIQPALVYASITGYGQQGLYSERPGYDFVIQAQSGLMSITGPETGEPYKMGVAISDVIAGLFAATSILAALRHAEKTGVGQHLDISLLDTSLAALVNIASGALVSNLPAERYGNAHPSIVPYQLFDAEDGPFALAVGNDRQYAAMCSVIGRPDLVTDARFAINPDRVANRDALIGILQTIFRTRKAEDWLDALLKAGVPAGPLNTVQAALHDPHVQARGIVQEVSFLDDMLKMIGPVVGFSETPAEIRAAPPRLGEHTDTILQGIGYGNEAIAQMRERGGIL